MKNFRQRLAHAMQMAGYNQSSLARACGVTRGAVNQWISGRVNEVTGEHLLRVAKALQVTPEWLQRGSPNKKDSLQTEQIPAIYQVDQSTGSGPVRTTTQRLVREIIEMEKSGGLSSSEIRMLQSMLEMFRNKLTKHNARRTTKKTRT